MVIWDDSKIYLQHEDQKTFHFTAHVQLPFSFLLSLTVFQMYHPSLNHIFSLLYSWNFLLAFALSIPLKCPVDKSQCLFWVLVLLDLYFTLLSLPCNPGILFFGLWGPSWSFPPISSFSLLVLFLLSTGNNPHVLILSSIFSVFTCTYLFRLFTLKISYVFHFSNLIFPTLRIRYLQNLVFENRPHHAYPPAPIFLLNRHIA